MDPRRHLIQTPATSQPPFGRSTNLCHKRDTAIPRTKAGASTKVPITMTIGQRLPGPPMKRTMTMATNVPPNIARPAWTVTEPDCLTDASAQTVARNRTVPVNLIFSVVCVKKTPAPTTAPHWTKPMCRQTRNCR